MGGIPLVSVIIPVYNGAPWIRDALDSVARQTYPAIEIIVVDDASTDETKGVVQSHPLRCIYVRNRTNKGTSAARNRGIRVCSGAYVAFLDQDDVWFADKISTQIALLEADPSIIALSCRLTEWRNPAIVAGQHEQTINGTPPVRRFDFAEMIVKNRLGVPSSVVVRRNDLFAVGLFDERITLIEDYDLWLRLVVRGPVARTEAVLGKYRIHAEAQGQGDRMRTHRNDVQYVRSLRMRYASQPGIARLLRRSLSVRFFEIAIQQCDECQNYGLALAKTLQSFFYWPWSDPHGERRLFVRLRRARRIVLEMTKTAIGRGAAGYRGAV